MCIDLSGPFLQVAELALNQCGGIDVPTRFCSSKAFDSDKSIQSLHDEIDKALTFSLRCC